SNLGQRSVECVRCEMAVVRRPTCNTNPENGTRPIMTFLKTSTRALVALSILVAIPPFARAPAGARPGNAQFTLANGLEMVVVPDHRTPVVTHMAWYKVGSADETPGKSGLAHFLEHLMFKGTAKNPEGRFSHTVSALGGQENAFTTADYTGYFQR